MSNLSRSDRRAFMDYSQQEKDDMVRARVMQVTLSSKKYGFRRVLAKLDVKHSDYNRYAWTDGISLGMNYDTVITLSDDAVMTILEHEVMHVAMRHPQLMRRLDPMAICGQRFNIAADLEVNGYVDQAQAKGLGLYRAQDYGFQVGKGTEWYFTNLPEDEKDDGDGKGDGDGQGEGDQKDDIGGVLPIPTDPKTGEPEESHITEQDIEQACKDAGASPNNEVKDYDNDIFNKGVIEKLLRMIRKRQFQSYTNKRQSRADRQLFGRSVTKTRQKEFAVYVDMSGSMYTYWKYFDSFINQLSKKDASYVGAFNTRLCNYTSGMEFGGGTDIQCIADHAKKNNYIPIVFTDGEYSDVSMPKESVYVLTEDYWDNREYPNKYVMKNSKKGQRK
jgi:predicted metal-dependent peptidase